MTAQVLELKDIISPDMLAIRISEKFVEWDSMRQQWKVDKEEIRRYVYATDTSHTSNANLPWKNKTTVPKLCQIRDNLYANYTATIFPQRKSIFWEANEKDANSVAKRDAIINYMAWAIDQPSFKHEIDKILLDYIDFGNCFATVEWKDERIQRPDGTIASGYVGPALRRISPLDLVMNPTAESFERSPKLIRSITNLGELRKKLDQMSNDENREEYEALWKYLTEIREKARETSSDWSQRDGLYQMDGFSSFREYLKSDYVEVLTFYGDIYDMYTDTFYNNHVITVVDRHKLIGNKPNPSYFGNPPIYHVPWRKKQENLWGMGPLDNLVGMQYRIDHVENLKADVFDLVTYPVQMVTGFVEEFTWQPGEKIFASDEGKVELLVPQVQALNANFEIDKLEDRMELMAGAPKEAMGFRSPGEKTKYEVQSLENAASRIFQNKIKQFEESLIEPLLNAMLELARRNMTGLTTIKVMDDEFKVATFQTLTVEDITGIGRIKPIAARNFAEQTQLIQNMQGLTQSQLWPFIQPHFSGIKIAKLYERIFNLDDYEIVTPFIALAEQAEGQQQAQALQEHLMQTTSQASGIGNDFDMIPPTNQQPIRQKPGQ